MAHASCRSFCIVAESCATTVRSPAMRNWSLVSGMYHANSPAGLARISCTLPLRRSVTMVMSGVSPRNPRYTTVRFAGRPSGFTVAI